VTTIKRKVLVVCCMILALALAGLPPLSEAQETAKTALRVTGAAMYSDQVQLWANEFTKADPTVSIVVHGSSAGKGLEALFDKNAEVAMVSRVIRPEERKKAEESGLKLETKLIGYAGLAVITHLRNPVSELTLDQLLKIYTGQFTSWQDVGGPAEPIRALSRRVPESGGAVFFQETALHNEPFGPKVVMADTWNAIVKVCSVATDLPIGICPVMRLNKDVRPSRSNWMRRPQASCLRCKPARTGRTRWFCRSGFIGTARARMLASSRLWNSVQTKAWPRNDGPSKTS